MLSTYLEVLRCLLQTYVSDGVIADFDAVLTHYIQLSTMSPAQYAKAVIAKSLKTKEVYEQYVLDTIFIKHLHKLVRH